MTTMTGPIDWSEVVRALTAHYGSQRKLAEEVGATQPQVSWWVTRKYSPSPRNRDRLWDRYVTHIIEGAP